MRKPIETSQFMTLPLPPAQRIERIREALMEERTAYRSAAAGSHDEHIAQLNIRNLEATLERAETNESIGLAAKQERRAAEDAKTRERTAEAAQELERRLMDTYMQASPGTTSEEAKAALPDIMHQHRMRQMAEQDQLIAAKARQYRI